MGEIQIVSFLMWTTSPDVINCFFPPMFPPILIMKTAATSSLPSVRLSITKRRSCVWPSRVCPIHLWHPSLPSSVAAVRRWGCLFLGRASAGGRHSAHRLLLRLHGDVSISSGAGGAGRRILRDRAPSSGVPVLAHHGESHDAPENTLVATREVCKGLFNAQLNSFIELRRYTSFTIFGRVIIHFILGYLNIL